MLVRNKSARGWWVAGVLIAPTKTEEVNCKEVDLPLTDDLEVVKEDKKSKKVEADNADAK